MCQLLGYKLDEILRLTASDLVPGGDRERLPQLMDRLLRSGRLSGEGTLLCKEGTTREVESQSVANILPGLHLAVYRDVTGRKRAEETLQASEKLFRAVFEGALVAMVLVDDDGRYVNANPAACELFGLPLDELLGRSIADFSEPDFDVYAARDEFRKSGSAEGLFRLVRLDGTVRETEFTATADVLPGRHLSVLRDVSERRRAEESLRKSERRVAAILESITDAFFAVDRQWRFTYVNAQAGRLWNRAPAELLGKNVWEEFSQAVGTAFEYQAHRAARRAGRGRFRRVLSGPAQEMVQRTRLSIGQRAVGLFHRRHRTEGSGGSITSLRRTPGDAARNGPSHPGGPLISQNRSSGARAAGSNHSLVARERRHDRSRKE